MTAYKGFKFRLYPTKEQQNNQQNAGLLPVCVQPHAGTQNQSIQAAQRELQLHWDAESAPRDEEVSAVAC